MPDLQASNVHLRIEEGSILKGFGAAELRTPSPRKVDGDRVVYESRGLKLPKKHGRPVLCGFGEAHFGKETYTDDIQPYVFRAPEIILDIPWTYSVDIWNVGVMVSVSDAKRRLVFCLRIIFVLLLLASFHRFGTSSKTSTCSMLGMATARIQACITWLKWWPCWACRRWIIFSVRRHHGSTLMTLVTGKARLRYQRSR